MDLTPLYELRERLKAGALAGTDLVSEDFRLKRAVEAFAPLEAASPVFAKVGQLAKAVITPECADRAGALLDAITLADAVICTQGAVAVQGEIEPIAVQNWGTALTNAPYSVLSTLLDALTASGGGRYSFLLETHKQQPELFQDFRVKAAMVKALGAPYAELAQEVAGWLKECGPEILPLLQNGFDPKGKKEMVRRVTVMEAIAGAKANDFYLSQLEEAEKDVRAALIYALRHTQDNEEILLRMVKKERGNSKKMVYWALSQMNGDKVWEFWNEFFNKDAKEAAQYMILSKSSPASRLVSATLCKLLEPFEEQGKDAPLTQETALAIEHLLRVLAGKSGPEVCECFRRAAALEETLDRCVDGKKEKWLIPSPTYSFREDPEPFSEAVAVVMRYSLLLNPFPELEALAEELYQTYGAKYIPPAMTARFLNGTAQACYHWVEPLLEQKTILGKKTVRDFMDYVYYGLSAVYWQGKTQSFVLRGMQYEGVTETYIEREHELAQPLDERFYDLLMRCDMVQTDALLIQWLQPDQEELCAKLGKYFYDKAMIAMRKTDRTMYKDGRMYLDYLKRCHYPDCTGLLTQYCLSQKNVALWEIISNVNRLPGNNKARADETQRVYDLIEKGKIKAVNLDMEKLKDFISQLRNEETVSLT